MTSARNSSRIIGALLIVQLVLLILPFILVMPVATRDFLAVAAGHASQIRIGVLLLLANGGLTIAISLAAFPHIRRYGEGAALLLLAVSIIWFTMQAIDNAHIMSMLSLSSDDASGGTASVEGIKAIAASMRSTRTWVHYTELLVFDAWFLAFYGALFRYSLVPRPLAGFGIAMAVIHASAIPLPFFLQYTGMPWAGVSLAFSHLAVGGWLIAKGFDQRGD